MAKATEAQKRAAKKYQAKKRASGEFAKKNKFIQMHCHVINDADVLEFMQTQTNKSGLLKQLVREYMKKQQ